MHIYLYIYNSSLKNDLNEFEPSTKDIEILIFIKKNYVWIPCLVNSQVIKMLYMI